MLGTYEYPDFPMDTKTFGVSQGEHIPGTVVHEYLTKYAQHFDIAGTIRCNCRVVSVERKGHDSGGWVLTVNDGPDGTLKKLLANKLVLATGLTSEPFLPHIKGQETFNTPLFHAKDFPDYADTLESAKSVTVFGGTKSAWDIVYQYATKGVHVDWIIRGTSAIITSKCS